MLGEKLNSNVNGVLNRAHGLVPKGAEVMGFAYLSSGLKFQVPSFKFGYADFRFAPIQVSGSIFGYADFRFAPIQNPILNKSRRVENKVITTNLDILPTSDFGLPSSVFGLPSHVFGLPTASSSSFFYRNTTFAINSNIFCPQFYNLNFQNLKSFSVSKVEQNWASAFSSINFIYLHTGTSPPRCRAPVETP